MAATSRQGPRRGFFVLGLMAMSVIGFGCVGSMTDQLMNSLTGGRIGAKANDGQLTFVDKETNKKYILGENIVIPVDFPKEMFVYPGSKILAVTTGMDASLNVKADVDADTVVKWYADKLKISGWKEASKVAAGGYENRSYTKDTITLSFTFLGSRDSDSKSTVISISRKEVK